MNRKHFSLFSLLFCVWIFPLSILAQNINEVREISASLDQFALKFLAKTSVQGGDELNIALSPYTIWNLLAVIREGAQENTAVELENALGISPSQDKDTFRNLFRTLGTYLSRPGDGETILDTVNAIFTPEDQQLRPEYLNVVQQFYGVEVTPIDFKNTANALSIINNRISTITRGRISDFVKSDDIQDAEVFMASVLFFKGAWLNEFNKTATSRMPFYDSTQNQIGEVDMMFNIGAFPFSLVLNDKATAVELPYKGNISMIAILPKANVPLQSILDMLTEVPFSSVIGALDKSVEDFGDDPVKVFLPKFSIISDLTLNVILDQMGVRDVFSAEHANLLGMFNHYLHVSRILQRAEIQVNEEGTVASSASGATLQYKSHPAKFLANKPFAYFIYDKGSRGIIFAGKLSNPQKI